MRVADRGGLPKRAGRRGGEGRLKQPLGISSPGLTMRRERKWEGRGVHSDRGNMASGERRVDGGDDDFSWC